MMPICLFLLLVAFGGGGGGVATFNMAGIDLSMYICARMCLDIWLA